MLRLILDEHFSERVSQQVRARSPGLPIIAMKDWQSGMFLGTPDELWLAEAAKQHLTLVTYDRATIPPVLKQWGERGRSHGGVIFVDDRTIRQRDIGGIVKAIVAFWTAHKKLDWTDRVDFLRSA